MPFGTIQLNDGNNIPAIAYGTGSKWKGHDVVEFVELAVETGFYHLDTAQFYETERDVGTAIRETGLARSEFFIATKYGYGNVRDIFNKSINNLGLKYVDLYLIHGPENLTKIPIEDVWAEFEKIQKDGGAKSIGVSNFKVEHLERLRKSSSITPAVNQINFHPYNYQENKAVLEYATEHKITIEAYSSLAPITRYPGGPVDAPLAAAAARRGASPTQINLLWVKAKGAVIVTTSSTKAHLEEYLAVADLEPLSDEEIAAIDEAGKNGPPTITWQMFKAMSWKKQVISTAPALLFALGMATIFNTYYH